MNILKEGFFVMVFSATGDTIKTEQEAKEWFQISIIPTPREISKSCGLAIRFMNPEQEDLNQFFQEREVPCALYFLSERKTDGKRKAEKMAEKK